MKNFLAILILIVIAGCSKPLTAYRATLFNPTAHDIKILFYQNGIVMPNDTILMPSNTQFLLAYGPTGRGAKTGIGRGFNSDYYGDSIVVVFDNIYSITHYMNIPLNSTKHYYLFSSLRNIGNPYSYEYTIVDDGGTVNDHKYYFTEQDYLDAKD